MYRYLKYNEGRQAHQVKSRSKSFPLNAQRSNLAQEVFVNQVLLGVHDEFPLVRLGFIRLDLLLELRAELRVGLPSLFLLLGLECIEFLLFLFPDFSLLIIIGLLITLTGLLLGHLLHEKIMHVNLLVGLLVALCFLAFFELAFTSVLIAKHLLFKTFVLCLLDFSE